MNKLFGLLIVGLIALTGFVLATPGNGNGNQFGDIFLNGDVAQTFGVPANLPHGGTDPLYVVSNGVSEQIGIAGLGPGEQGYSGGDWAFYSVAFNTGVTPYLLTSDEAVAQAEASGDVTVTRIEANDFRCPILP